MAAPAGPSTRFLERMLDPWSDDIAVRMAHAGRTDPPAIACVPFDAGRLDDEPLWSSGDVRVRAAAVDHQPVAPSVAFRIDTPDGAVVVIEHDVRSLVGR